MTDVYDGVHSSNSSRAEQRANDLERATVNRARVRWASNVLPRAVQCWLRVWRACEFDVVRVVRCVDEDTQRHSEVAVVVALHLCSTHFIGSDIRELCDVMSSDSGQEL